MTQTKHKKGFKSLKSSLKIGMEHREGDVHEMHKNDILHENNFTETIKDRNCVLCAGEESFHF